MYYETYQFTLAAQATDRCWPSGTAPESFRAIETDILAWHGCYPDSGAMTQRQLAQVLDPFSTTDIQTWAITCVDHDDCYQMTPGVS